MADDVAGSPSSDSCGNDGTTSTGSTEVETVQQADVDAGGVESTAADVQETDDQVLTNGEDKSDVVDILGNGSITKKTLSPGLGRETRPNHGDLVAISYEGCLLDGTVVDQCDECVLVLGDGDSIQAFDLAVSLAELQEEMEVVTADRFAYGDKGREPDIPPNSQLIYRVKLLRCEDPPDYSKMSVGQRLSQADGKRERGNFLYRRDEYSLSVNSYTKALKILENGDAAATADSSNAPTAGQGDGGQADDKHRLLQAKLKLRNNLAAAQIKIEAYDAAIESCDCVLRHEPNNVKALFRKGKAQSARGDYVEAMVTLKQALAHEPTSRLTMDELARARELWRNECAQRARVCKRMFGNLAGSGASNASADGGKTGRRGWRSKLTRFGLMFGAVLTVAVSVGLATIAVKWHTGASGDVSPTVLLPTPVDVS